MTVFAVAVDTVADSDQSPVDLINGERGLRRHREVALPLDRDARTLARLVVELHVARLHVSGYLISFGSEHTGLLRVDPALVEK